MTPVLSRASNYSLMVAERKSKSFAHVLVAIHRPLGIMILILAAIRFVNRIWTKLPPFPPTMSRQERFLASSSEKLLYALMFALPLVGWGMRPSATAM